MINRRINIGINILRVWMAIEVILLHRMSWKGYNGFFFNFLKACEMFSVPVFMIISFYLSVRVFEDGNYHKFKERMFRLLIPQVGWAIICWVVYYLTDIIFMHEINHTITDLWVAIISGCRQNTNPSTWFQAVLIILTLYFFVLFKYLDSKKAWLGVYLSLIGALLIQYEGTYFTYFSKMNYELFNTVGRIFEIMPYACAGLILRHIDVYKIFNEKRWIVIAVCVSFFIIGFKIPFPQYYRGFFDGLYPLYMGIMLFIIFVLLPIQISDEKTYKTTVYLTKFTLGSYCAHRLVYGIMEIVYELLHLSVPNFSKCLITYLMCYIMSVIIYQIPNKYVRYLVD